MQQYEVEEIIRRNTQMNVCSYCEQVRQKVCWKCFQEEVERLDERISQLEKRIEELEMNGDPAEPEPRT